MRWIKATLKYLIIVVALLSLVITAFLYLAPTFGASPSGDSLARMQASPNYQGHQFKNKVKTILDTSVPGQSQPISTYFFPAPNKNPQQPLPSKPLDLSQLIPGKFVWLGHSTILYNASGKFILTDPVFNRASPVPLIGNPFPTTHSITINELPDIDVALISHDHYDHLDHLAIAKLKNKVRRFMVPLGISAHLQRWGIPANQITEFDWYEGESHNGVDFTLTPARHFSGRGITNRNSTLWGSWVIKTPQLNVWFSGDGGYFEELKTIGEKFGPFDIAFIENGAYSVNWDQIHMSPEQAVQASIDLQAKVFFPIHWSKFDLAPHTWKDPIERATREAAIKGVKITTPLIGEVFSPTHAPSEHWWVTAE